jgi:predicted type IV restriction endonuclease
MRGKESGLKPNFASRARRDMRRLEQEKGSKMSTIPKKVTERFARAIPRFQKVLQIAKDRDVNESDTVAVLTDMLAEVFGYEKYLEVTSEFAVRSTFCDLALKVEDQVQFLVEAKAIGMELKDAHIRQAVGYGANHGVQWVVLTNGIQWRIYRIRFEQPIDHDLVCEFDFLALDPVNEKDQESLFLLAKEGLSKSAREEFYDKVQSVNRFVVGNLVLAEPILILIRRELKKFSDGIKIEVEDVARILRTEVLKREIVEGEQAQIAQTQISKFYRKGAVPRRSRLLGEVEEEPTPQSATPPDESVTDRLLREGTETGSLPPSPATAIG